MNSDLRYSAAANTDTIQTWFDLRLPTPHATKLSVHEKL